MKFPTKTVCVAVMTVVSACSSSEYYRVRPGDTLSRISQRYGVSVLELARANEIANAERIEIGQRLLIPEGTEVGEARGRGGRVASLKPREEAPSTIALTWPLAAGVVISGFGTRNGSHHDGIDVSTAAGAAVLAAQNGEVVYSGFLRGYGNLVILRHDAGFSTVYAHNQANLVQPGQRVRRGSIIARVGTTGHARGANLHFEVRRDNVARNPIQYLPSNEQVAVGGFDHDG